MNTNNTCISNNFMQNVRLNDAQAFMSSNDLESPREQLQAKLNTNKFLQGMGTDRALTATSIKTMRENIEKLKKEKRHGHKSHSRLTKQRTE